MRDLRVINLVVVVWVLMLSSCQSFAPTERVATGPQARPWQEPARSTDFRSGITVRDERRRNQPSRRSLHETDSGALDDLIDKLTGSQALQGDTATDQARLVTERKAAAAEDARREFATLQRRKSDAIEVAAAFMSGRLDESVVNVDSILGRLSLRKNDQSRQTLLGRIADEMALPASERTIWQGWVGQAVLNDRRCGVDVVSEDVPTGRIFLRAEKGWLWRVAGFDTETMRRLLSGAGDPSIDSRVSAITNELIEGRFDPGLIDWPPVLESLGLPDAGEWAHATAEDYLRRLFAETGRRRVHLGRLVRMHEGAVVAVLNAREEAYWGGDQSERQPTDRELFRLKFSLGHDGAMRLGGVSPSAFRVVPGPPESHYALIAWFQKLRAAARSRDQSLFGDFIDPQLLGATGTDAPHRRSGVRLFLVDLEATGAMNTIATGRCVAIGQRRGLAMLSLAEDEERSWLIELRLHGDRWYLSDVFRPAESSSENEKAEDMGGNVAGGADKQ